MIIFIYIIWVITGYQLFNFPLFDERSYVLNFLICPVEKTFIFLFILRSTLFWVNLWPRANLTFMALLLNTSILLGFMYIVLYNSIHQKSLINVDNNIDMLMRKLAKEIYRCQQGLSQRFLTFKSDEKDYGIIFDEQRIKQKI